jgi:DNA-binding response OmpR family regulator
MHTNGHNDPAVDSPSRILVVEDDPIIGRATGLALQEAGGFAVELCDRGGKTLRWVRRFRPDLVLLDANLPDMDGQAVLASIRRDPQLADLPVIFVTGQAMPQDQERYRDMGALGVIAKPYDPYELADRVRRIWQAYHG